MVELFYNFYKCPFVGYRVSIKKFVLPVRGGDCDYWPRTPKGLTGPIHLYVTAEHCKGT